MISTTNFVCFYFLTKHFQFCVPNLESEKVVLHWGQKCLRWAITQGPIPEIFTKKYWELGVWKSQFFLVGHFEFFFSKEVFFCFILMKIRQKLWGRMNVTQFLWSLWFPAKKLRIPNIFGPSVCTIGSTFLSSHDGKFNKNLG